MRNRYGRALIGLTAAVAIGSSLGLSAAGAASASPAKAKPAITPSCSFDNYCSDPLFNVEFGIQFFTNNVNANDRVGNPVNLSWANDNNPGQDWRVNFQYPVFVLYHLGFISAGMELHYHFRPAFEVMWTPYGVTSNLCRGVARNAYNGENVTLQPCGNFPKTIWVVRGGYYHSADYGGFELINGSTMNPSVPYVLTAGGSLFGGNPFAQLRLFQPVANNGIVNPGQLWCTASITWGDSGVAASASPTPSTSSSLATTGPPTVGPPTVGPPTYTANPDCFPGITIS